MSTFRVLSILSFALFLASCEKKENPYQLPVAGPSKVITVGMTENYSRQVFLSLATGDTTGSASRTDGTWLLNVATVPAYLLTQVKM